MRHGIYVIDDNFRTLIGLAQGHVPGSRFIAEGFLGKGVLRIG